MKKIKSFDEFNESKKWMQNVKSDIDKKGTKGELRKAMHAKKGKSIPLSQINKEISRLKKKENLTAAERKKEKQLVLARTFRKSKKK